MSARNAPRIGRRTTDNARPVANDLDTTVKSNWTDDTGGLPAGDGPQTVSAEELVKWLSAQLQTDQIGTLRCRRVQLVAQFGLGSRGDIAHSLWDCLRVGAPTSAQAVQHQVRRPCDQGVVGALRRSSPNVAL
jgi:hypothetical protein